MKFAVTPLVLTPFVPFRVPREGPIDEDGVDHRVGLAKALQRPEQKVVGLLEVDQLRGDDEVKLPGLWDVTFIPMPMPKQSV